MTPGLIITLGFLAVFFLIIFLSKNGLSMIDAITIVFFIAILLWYVFVVVPQ